MPVSPLPHAGKLAIITGASRGIGAACAHNLAQKGANVLLNYSSPNSTAECEAVAKEVRDAYGVRAEVIQVDMGAVDGPAKIVAFAKEKFASEGGKFQIDVIINNAGVSHNQSLPEVTVEEFDWQYRVNVLGPLLLVQAAQPYLPTDRSGRIVNISSVSATLGLPLQSVYGGTKAALDSMTRTWSRELAENCTVNSVNPGPVATRMYQTTSEEFSDRIMKPFILHAPLMQLSKDEEQSQVFGDLEAVRKAGGRQALPEEIAGVVGMLCSKEAGWCTGSVVGSNGGMVMGLS